MNSFLGYVDLLGTTYSSPTMATGFGAHIAIPLLREAYEAKAGIEGDGPLLTEEEAEKLLAECMKVLFYRDARSMNKVGGLSTWCYLADGSTKLPRSTRTGSLFQTRRAPRRTGSLQRD